MQGCKRQIPTCRKENRWAKFYLYNQALKDHPVRLFLHELVHFTVAQCPEQQTEQKHFEIRILIKKYHRESLPARKQENKIDLKLVIKWNQLNSTTII